MAGTRTLRSTAASPGSARSSAPGCSASSATTRTATPSAKARKNYAGTAPITRASGRKKRRAGPLRPQRPPRRRPAPAGVLRAAQPHPARGPTTTALRARGIGHRGQSVGRPRRRLTAPRRALASRRRRFEPAVGRVGRRARRVGGQRRPQHRGQPLAGGLPVAQLAAVLRGDDVSTPSTSRRRQPALRPLPQVRRERGRAGEVERQLDARVGRVHSLPARPGRTGEPPVQLASGQHQRSPDREITLGHAAGYPSSVPGDVTSPPTCPGRARRRSGSSPTSRPAS